MVFPVTIFINRQLICGVAIFFTYWIAPKNRSGVNARYPDDSRIIAQEAGKRKNSWGGCRKNGIIEEGRRYAFSVLWAMGLTVELYDHKKNNIAIPLVEEHYIKM